MLFSELLEIWELPVPYCLLVEGAILLCERILPVWNIVTTYLPQQFPPPNLQEIKIPMLVLILGAEVRELCLVCANFVHAHGVVSLEYVYGTIQEITYN